MIDKINPLISSKTQSPNSISKESPESKNSSLNTQDPTSFQNDFDVSIKSTFKQAMANSQQNNSEKIANIKLALSNGDYPLNAEKIAEAFLHLESLLYKSDN